MADEKTIEEVLNKKSENEQIVHLRKKNEELERFNDRLRAEIGEGREFAQAIQDALIAADPFPAVPAKQPEKASSPVSAALILSDWHIGERISKDETEGFGEYSYAIAEKRLFEILDAFFRWTDVQRTAYKIDRCAVFGVGDYISGDIHLELIATNEFPVPVQTARAGRLLGEVLRRTAARFKKVDFFGVGADNHGRLTKKKPYKQKAINNMSFLVHAIAQVYTERCKNLDFMVAPGIKYLAQVAGFSFLVEHGDEYRGWMGIPHYGIQRGRHREAEKRMKTGKEFDYQIIGHFHTPNLLEDKTIINGSLSGTSEFDHGQGRYARPSQVGFFVHPKHGVFNWTPFRVK